MSAAATRTRRAGSTVAKTKSATCARCEVTSTWLTEHDRRAAHPKTWAKDGAEVYCLACQRARAAEAGAENAPADANAEKRAKARQHALIDFEVTRDPDRTNGEIAKAIRCSVPAVLKARERLGIKAA